MAFAVRTPVFEGPFDLLLHLILQEEVELWDVPLARIVDAYLDELERMETLDLDVATEFLLIAATLVELKARRLLPAGDEVEIDEELLRFEERDLLLARLLECKTFKDAAAELERRSRVAARSVARTAGPEEPFRSLAPDPLENVSLEALRDAAFRALTEPEEPIVSTEHVAPVRASVRDAVETVLGLLADQGTTTFRALTREVTERLELVIRFLAILELYKQGVVDLEQAHTFGTLVVRPLDEGEAAFEHVDSDAWGETEIAAEGEQRP